MELLYDLFLGVALAMDAAAISMAAGANSGQRTAKAAIVAALAFGIFQIGMILIGWAGGDRLKVFVLGFGHLLAFLLLAAVGLKMIYEALSTPSNKQKTDLFEPHILLTLSIATSIDALVVGAGLAFVDGGIVLSAIIVGIVTALFSFISVFVGHKYGEVFENKAELVGGLVLLLIGLKMLIGNFWIFG